MIRFNNDYNHGAHPAILKALEDTNDISYEGYGLDSWCLNAEKEILKYLDNPNSKVFFLLGGTQANFTFIAAALRPYESIISASSGHINVHETGAVENTGHKIVGLPHINGKITAKQIEEERELFNVSGIKEHITEPKMVYISYPTEYGTLYSKKELEEIHNVCKKNNMYLFIDGARAGYGLTSHANDVTMQDLARLSDAFYFGGTKCGALFGEALVINNKELQPHFRSYIKQNGAMLAKGWLLGIQFYTLFKDGLYLDICKKANDYAMQIKDAFSKKKIKFYIESDTNQQFVILTNAQIDKLAKKYYFEDEGRINDNEACVRFCTSWATKQEEVDSLIKDIEEL